MRRRPLLTWMLAALLLLQWGTAFAHCLKLNPPAEALLVELCTTEGPRQVSLADDDQTRQDDSRLAAKLLCPACQGPASVLPPEPPLSVGMPVLPALAATAPPLRLSPPLAQPFRPGQPRAPPAIS